MLIAQAIWSSGRLILLNRANCLFLSYAYLLPTPFGRCDRQVNMLLDTSPGNTGMLYECNTVTAANAKSTVHTRQRWVGNTSGGMEHRPNFNNVLILRLYQNNVAVSFCGLLRRLHNHELSGIGAAIPLGGAHGANSKLTTYPTNSALYQMHLGPVKGCGHTRSVTFTRAHQVRNFHKVKRPF